MGPEVDFLYNASLNINDTLQEVLKQVLSKLITIIQPASAQIISILTKRCCEALLPVRSIPSQFRAMSSKRLPTEPSHFVQTIFRAIKAFFAISASDGPGRTLKDAHLRGYSQEIFDNVAQRQRLAHSIEHMSLVLNNCIGIFYI